MEFSVKWPDEDPVFQEAMAGVEGLDLSGIGATMDGWHGDRVRIRFPKPFDHLTLTHGEDLSQDVPKAIEVYNAVHALGGVILERTH